MPRAWRRERPRPDQGAVLVGGHQRRGGGAADGDHHVHGGTDDVMGSFVAAAGIMGDGVVVYGDNGSGGGDYVCDLVRLVGVGRRPGVRSE